MIIGMGTRWTGTDSCVIRDADGTGGRVTVMKRYGTYGFVVRHVRVDLQLSISLVDIRYTFRLMWRGESLETERDLRVLRAVHICDVSEFGNPIINMPLLVSSPSRY
jgi:hypothetical protein